MDGQGWRRFSGLAFLGVVLAVGLVQVLAFRVESTGVGLKTMTEALVFVTVAVALVVVPYSEELSSVDAEAAAKVYPPVLLGLGLVAVGAGSDLLDEFLSQSDAFSSVFEDLTLVLGVGALLVGVLRWNRYQSEQARLLQRQRDRLEQQNDRLERFAGVVSHDLRNPLDVARGRLRYARETGEDEHFEEAASALDRMEAIVTEVLTLVDAGDESVDRSSVRLGEVVEDAWGTVDTGEASLAVRNDDASVQADYPLLRQLFENLLRNAIEHGGDGVSVRVGTTADGFYLEDDGPGIDPGDREDVFEVGYTTSSMGTGLGLNIVAEIADSHEWTVAVDESDDGGARFEFSGVATDPDATQDRRSPAV
jgi:signal transduction histidine kinase